MLVERQAKRIQWHFVMIANVLMLIFVVLILPWMSQLSVTLIGSELALDTAGVYTQAYLYEVAAAYGEQGRFYYTVIRYTFDLIWPFVYWFFLSVNLAVLLRRQPRVWRGFWLVLWLPTLALIFDLLENISITLVFWRYPTVTPVIDSLAPWMSQLKWLFVGASFLALAAFCLYRLGLWLTAKVITKK